MIDQLFSGVFVFVRFSVSLMEYNMTIREISCSLTSVHFSESVKFTVFFLITRILKYLKDDCPHL